jgi:hypothetical protein
VPTKPSLPPPAPTKPSAPPLAATKLQSQKRKKRTSTPGTQSSGTQEEPLPKKPTPEVVYWAKSMLNQPPQYILNAPDDYTRTLKKQYEKNPDVPQLGQQANQSIPPSRYF